LGQELKRPAKSPGPLAKARQLGRALKSRDFMKERKMTKESKKATKQSGAHTPAPLTAMPGLDVEVFEAYFRAGQTAFESAVALNEELMRFAGERLQADIDALKTLPRCANWQEMASAQSDFMTTAAEAYQVEASKLLARGLEAATSINQPLQGAAMAGVKKVVQE